MWDATVATLKKRIGAAGYDEGDVAMSIATLLEWGLIESDSLTFEDVGDELAVRMHATGFIHMRFFLERLEYLVGVTTDMRFASKELAEEIGSTWASGGHLTDIPQSGKVKIMGKLKAYFEEEYRSRCARHAFYEEFGYGGRAVMAAFERAEKHLAPR